MVMVYALVMAKLLLIQVSDLASIIQLQIDGNCCRPHIPTRAIRLGEIWYGDGAVPPTEYLFCKVLATVGGTAPSCTK